MFRCPVTKIRLDTSGSRYRATGYDWVRTNPPVVLEVVQLRRDLGVYQASPSVPNVLEKNMLGAERRLQQ